MVFMQTPQANAASGMAVHDDCKSKFLELKAKRTYRFIVFKIEEKQKEVIVEKVGEPAQSYEDFTASLPADECRYAVYDFDFVTEENCQKSRIFFIAWSPDTSRVRSKMIYASSKDRFKRELDGIQIELQATDPTEIGLDVIRSRATWIQIVGLAAGSSSLQLFLLQWIVYSLWDGEHANQAINFKVLPQSLLFILDNGLWYIKRFVIYRTSVLLSGLSQSYP